MVEEVLCGSAFGLSKDDLNIEVEVDPEPELIERYLAAAKKQGI
jgi:hypothetical protein